MFYYARFTREWNFLILHCRTANSQCPVLCVSFPSSLNFHLRQLCTSVYQEGTLDVWMNENNERY